MRSALLTLTLATALLAGLAPAAVARPRVWIEDVILGERFGRDAQCYATGSIVSIGGSGFLPHSFVRFGKGKVRTGRDGGFGILVEVDTPRAQERVALHFAQPGREATLRYWAGVRGVVVPSWSGDGPVTGTPGRIERVRAGGFDWAIGRRLYVHYLFGGAQVHAAPVGVLKGPCGAVESNLVQFPFRPVAAGLYRVDFGTRAVAVVGQVAVFPAVRIGAAPVLAAPPRALFTVAGNAATGPLGDGGPATAATLWPYAKLAPLPDGSFLVTDATRVRRVDQAGRITTVAGAGATGPPRDGVPAVDTALSPSEIVAHPSGGFVVSDCTHHRVMRVGPDGLISTLASTIGCPGALAVMPDGAIVMATARFSRLHRIAPDGSIRAIAGTGEVPTEPVEGGPALTTPLSPSDIAVLPDGSMLVADSSACRVYRLANGVLTPVAGTGSEGMRRDDGVPALDAAVCPTAIAPLPGGGYYVVDVGWSRMTGGQPRLRLVQPDGTIFTVAGTGRFAPDPSRSDEERGDGGPPGSADLRMLRDVAVLPDGGVLFTEGPGDGFGATHGPGLVRYLPPPVGGRLAVAVRRDRNRIFTPGARVRTTISLTAPAEVTIAVREGTRAVATRTVSLPAGDTTVESPPLPGRPHTVVLSAVDTGGRVAVDRAAILPRGWLATPLARSVAEGIALTAVPESAEVLGCRRAGPQRVDCSLTTDDRHCRAVVEIRLGPDGRLRWGRYRCPVRARQRPGLQPLHRRDYICEISDVDCPPPVTGIVAPRWLVPWD